MRHKHKRDDGMREKWRFLLIPLELRGETRWLEWALIKEEYCYPTSYDDCHGWAPVEFLNP